MSKKTDSIELRVSPEQKAALAALSRDRGTSMSALLRGLVDRELDGSDPMKTRTGDPRMAFTSLTMLGKVGLAAVPVVALTALYAIAPHSPVAASPEIRVAFANLDQNGDGVISQREYAGHLQGEMDEEGPFQVPAACLGTWIADEANMTAEDIAEEEITEIDSDADGGISYEELSARMLAERAEEFLEVDENQNGFVTHGELKAAFLPDPDEDALEEAALEDEDDDLPAACRSALNAIEMAEEASDEDFDPEAEAEELRLWIAEIDANRDGQVSLMEYLTH